MTKSLQVMSTLAVELALESGLLPTWQTGSREAEMSWNPTGVLIDRVKRGNRGDVIIAIDQAIADLTDAGILRRGSSRPLARATFGLGVQRGAPRPDISTPDKFREALVSARSIAYSETGASGLHFQQVMEAMGIAETVGRNATVIHSGFTADRVITGEADLAVQQISELMCFKEIAIVGPFPEPYQKNTDFSAAIFTDAALPDLAQEFVAHLTNPLAAEVYSRSGLTPRIASTD